MTTPTGLHLVWASTGGADDPTDTKYKLGWEAEIPTFQNFNYVLQGLDKAKLSYAESDIYPWQDFIAYQAGARVKAGGIYHTCITTHNDNTGSNPQDPILDVTNSYWVTGTVYSNKASAYTNLLPKEGFKLDEVVSRNTTNLWESNDLTVLNKSALLALSLEDNTYDNLLFGNVRGKLMVHNAANVTDPDSTDLAANAFAIYHEDNKPTQADVSGTIPDAPSNGKAYSRKDGNWTVDEGVTTVNPLLVSGEAIFGGITNQMRDSGAFTVPNANSVPVNTMLYLELSEIYKSKTPSVTTIGGNLFRNSLGTDNVLNFIGPAFVELISNGNNEWAVFERAKDGLDGKDASTGVFPYTVNGILIAGGANNQLRDSGTFTLPFANSVLADTIIVIELPVRYSADTPKVIRRGSDFIADNGSLVHVDIDFAGAAKITLTSDGVSTWSL